MQSDKERLRPTLDQLTPLLNQIGVELLMMGDATSDLPALVSLIERQGPVKTLTAQAGLERAYQMTYALEELLSGLLCEQYKDAPAALTLLNQLFSTLQAHIEALGTGEDSSERNLPIVLKAFELLGVTPVSLPAAANSNPSETPPAETATAEQPPAPQAQTATTQPAATGALDEEHTSKGLPENFEDPDLYKEFVFESFEHLETIEEKILNLENSPDDLDLINVIFRAIHSVKGGAGFLNLIGVNRLAHDTETLLDRCRKKQLVVTGRVIELCLRSVDCLKQMIRNLGTVAEAPTPDPELVQPVVFGPVRQAIREYLENPEAAEAKARTDKSSPRKLGEVLLERGDITPDQLSDALDLQEAPLGQILVKTGVVSPDKVEKALEKQRDEGGAGEGATHAIKVDTSKIDSLVNLVGELVIIEAQIAQMMHMVAAAANGSAETVEKNVSQLGKITKELQDRSMALRMMPIRQTFQKMTRLVRDSSKKMDKKVNLVISGEETELDKTVVEQIGDPLVHIIRNSVDHGIEPPEDRIAAGKPETGTVNLEAFYQGDQIVIRIRDDGRGLNRERILAKAIESGLLKPGANPSDSEVYQLIFAAGLSTAAVVTDISGRGVGMDVVKRNIEKLRGRIDIVSVPGKGTTISIILPLTLAIIDGMVVRVGEEQYIIPTVAIEESMRPKTAEITRVAERGELISVRGSLVPLVRLHSMWGIEPRSTDPCDSLVVIVENDGKRGCLMVDELVGQQQIVIKNLGEQFGDVRGFAGATILGDGRVGLILDVGAILNQGLGN